MRRELYLAFVFMNTAHPNLQIRLRLKFLQLVRWCEKESNLIACIDFQLEWIKT